MPPPEPYGTSLGTTPSGDKKSAAPVGENFSASEVTDVFKTLAAHSGGTASCDLALDLVLNEVVEQARLATGATGAAIGLIRDGEMVCRATTGSDAPDLGVRFETTTGLSGECLRTGKVQQCDDTETDPRVNAEACRSLGVRSILVLPLAEGNGAFGILEVFSARPTAFRDRDVRILQVVARHVVESKRAAEVAAAPPVSNDRSNDRPNMPSNGTKQLAFAEPISDQSVFDQSVLKYDSFGPHEQNSSSRAQLWTYILSALVIVVAILLGLALGWRGGAGQRASAISPKRMTVRPTDSPARKADRGTDSAVAAEPSAVSSKAPANEGSSEGLLVTQDGKVIFRLPPSEQSSPVESRALDSRPAAEGSKTVSGSRLIHRVEPKYPADARAQRIEGAVVLDVQIGKEGAVQDIAIVEGNSELAEAAVEAVRQWRYRPYTVSGHPVEMQARITVRFKLPPA
jgi:TonB family protein